jgi:hypothetical protein
MSRGWTFYRFADQTHFETSAIPSWFGGKKTKNDPNGVTRIDGAPRWNRTSDRILVGGVAEDGTRQMFIIHNRAATKRGVAVKKGRSTTTITGRRT